MDWASFEGVNDLVPRTAWAHGPMADYARYGLALFGVLLLVGGLVGLRTGPRATARAVWAGIAPLVALGLNQPIANAVKRPRPYVAHPDIALLVPRSHDPSFMSDHAIVVGAVAAGIWFVSRRLAWVALGAAVVMAFARVYVGAHYPGDVVAGLGFGAAIACLGIPLVDRYGTPVFAAILHTRVGRLVELLHLRPLT